MVPVAAPQMPDLVTAPKPASNAKFYSFENGAPQGTWYVVHLLAANGERTALLALMAVLAKRFVCPKCRGHIAKYLTSNPIPDDGTDSLFAWSMDFHNAVSKRLTSYGHAHEVFGVEKTAELFRQLTTGADDDGVKYATTGDCDGCGRPPTVVQESTVRLI